MRENKKTNIKAIFFDLDGTLLSFKTHTIPESTICALKALQAKSIKLFVATGRPPFAIAFLKDIFEFDGYVTTNGQYCYTPDSLIHHQAFDMDTVQNLVRLAQTTPFPCLLIEKESYYINYIDDAVRAHCILTNQPLPAVRDLNRVLHRDIYQFVAYLDQGNEHILADMQQIQRVRAVPTCLDVLPAGGGKMIGIRAMLQHFGLTAKEIISFGDGLNDMDMLAFSQIGIAMGNAATEVLQMADYITDDVDHHGIINALQFLKIL